MPYPSVLCVAVLLVACTTAKRTTPVSDLVPNRTVHVTDGMLVSGLYYVVDSGYGYPRLTPYAEVYVDPSPIVTVGNYAGVSVGADLAGEPAVMLQLDAAGTARWRVATQRSVRRQVAVVVRNLVVAAPVIQGEIPSGRASFCPPDRGPLSVAEYVQVLRAEQPHVPPVR